MIITITIESPFEVYFADERLPGPPKKLCLTGGEWRFDYRWIGRGLIGRPEAIKRALQEIEKLHQPVFAQVSPK